MVYVPGGRRRAGFKIASRSGQAHQRALMSSLRCADQVQVTKRSRDRDDGGFGLIEMTAALSILVLVLFGFQAMLTASLQTYSQARLTTLGQQVASDRLEQARRWKWDDLGTVTGSPHGTIPDDTATTVGTISFAIHTAIVDVLDPSTGASMNVRKVTVSVTRTGTTLAPVTLATLIASPTAGSVAKSTIVVSALDFCDANKPIPGLTVTIDKGPSAPISQSTGVNGKAQFTNLTATYAPVTPTPAGVPQDYYSIIFTDAASPYALIKNSANNQIPVNSDAPAAWNPNPNFIQFALDPGTIKKPILLLTKKGRLVAHVRPPSGSGEINVPGSAVFKNSDSGLTYTAQPAGSTPFAVSSMSSGSVTDVVSPCEDSKYSFVFTPSGQNALTSPAMSLGGTYAAGDLDVDGYVQLPNAVNQVFKLQYSDGTAVTGATVQLTAGGPVPIPTATPVLGTSDLITGQATFSVQYNSAPYHVKILDGPPSALAPTGWVGTELDYVIGQSPTTKTITLARPATVSQDIRVVDSAGTAAPNASVTVTGGSGPPQTGFTNSAGLLTLPMQPSTIPYSIAVASQTPIATAPLGWQATTDTLIVTPVPTTKTVTVPLPATVTQQITVQFPLGVAVHNPTVTLGTGPTAQTKVADSSGQVSFTAVQPNAVPYALVVAAGTSGNGNATGWLTAADTVIVTTTPTGKTITVVPV